MSDIQTFTSFTTSNCYVVTPENNSDICYIIDLPPDVEPALEYVCLLYTSPSPRD